MDLSQITQGQKDWVKTLNSDIKQLAVSEDTTRDLVYKNGWSIATDDESTNFVTKTKTIAGTTIYYYIFDLKCAQMSPGTDDNGVQLPDGYVTGRYQPVGNAIPVVGATNSYGKSIIPHFTGPNTLCFKCVNIDGTPAQVWQDVEVVGAIIWI